MERTSPAMSAEFEDLAKKMSDSTLEGLTKDGSKGLHEAVTTAMVAAVDLSAREKTLRTGLDPIGRAYEDLKEVETFLMRALEYGLFDWNDKPKAESALDKVRSMATTAFGSRVPGHWTAVYPTEPGIYWFYGWPKVKPNVNRQPIPELVQVYERNGVIERDFLVDMPYDVQNMIGYFWSVPVPLPTNPASLGLPKEAE